MCNSQPLVTVIMPVRNEEAFITRSLTAVLNQDYPADKLQVIVADGMSIDRTREIVNSHRPLFAELELVDNPDKIVPTGMNAALARARGEVVVRVDGHCEIAPDYVTNCVRHLAEDKMDGVGGPLETIGETPLANLIARAMSSRFGVGGSAFRTVRDRTMLTDTVAFPAYTRKAIELAGPYDEELVRNQDDEYNYRLRSLGARILLASDVRARYYSRGSLISLWRQYFQYGFWKVRVMQKHPRQMRARHFVPAVFVSSLLLGISLGTFSTFARMLLGAEFGLYLAANLSASLLIALHPEDDTDDKLKSLLFFPLIFGVLHLSYGTGFLVGLLQFLHRWGDNGTEARSLQKFDRADQTMARAKPK